MPRVHIDILTPKQVLFFNEVIKELKKSGYETLITTRKYREVNQLLQLKKLKAVVVGKHGGATLKGKLESSLKRTLLLKDLLVEKKPNVSLSFSSPEAVRASFGLAIPHICVNDSPHAEAVAKLTVPLSEKLLTPYVIPQKAWIRLGASENMIVQYRALDPVVWLSRFRANPQTLKQLNLSKRKPIITIRLEETYAAYLTKFPTTGSKILPIIRRIVKEFRDTAQIVVIPRYEDQAPMLQKKFGKKITVAERVVDGPSLIAFSSVFIGGGGTMTAEAALLGIPTFFCHPRELTLVEKFLIHKKLVKRVTDSEVLIKRMLQILRNLEQFKVLQNRRAKQLTSKMENPVRAIKKVIAQSC
ncbi:MAG: DUF354 domain-containing protein [Candidatus Bathyarchaeota archaeon]